MSKLLQQPDLAPGSDVLRPPHVVQSVVLFSAGYYVGGIVGLQFNFPPSGITVVWPSTAILLSALLLTPPRYWWMYLLAVIPTHLHLVINFQHPKPPLVVALCQVASNVVEVVLAALVVRHVIGASPRFDSLNKMAAFMLLVGMTDAIACALAVSLFLLTGWAADFWLVWHQRILASTFPLITIPPLIVLTRARRLVGLQRTPLRFYAELGLLTTGLLVVGVPVFGWEPPGTGNVPGLLLAPLPILLWAAVRLGPGGLSLSLLVVAGIALANGYLGRGPFHVQSTAENVLSLQVFLLAISIPLMLLAALVEERGRTEQSLRATQRELAEVNRKTTIGVMAASIAHEINQPLSALVTNGGIGLRLLANADSDLDEVREVLKRMINDGYRASNIISSIRAVFGKDRREKSLVSIRDLVSEVLTLVRGELGSHRVSLQVELHQELPPVMGDRVQLQQVFLNLIMNAVEAMSSVESRERSLLVKSELHGAGDLLITVEDSGPGINPNDMDRIFDALFTTKSHGMGLGLSICQSIIASHNGRLWASARVPHGAVFYIQLPSGTAVSQ
jgi:signal transduction histidine kinase